ncbi:Deoxyribonuclease [Gossypium arboreum]|uniref:Deoxyribonuclease n=1 Tax=Gossypium arboreum TaxID=29729 RepID=A0A0B0ND53_GOSAR|nr:Deoxyribonuclease [Gossypium arboreum]
MLAIQSFPIWFFVNFSIRFFVNFPIMAFMSFLLYSPDKLPDRLFVSLPKWLCVRFPLQGSRVRFPNMCSNWVPLEMN